MVFKQFLVAFLLAAASPVVSSASTVKIGTVAASYYGVDPVYDLQFLEQGYFWTSSARIDLAPIGINDDGGAEVAMVRNQFGGTFTPQSMEISGFSRAYQIMAGASADPSVNFVGGDGNTYHIRNVQPDNLKISGYRNGQLVAEQTVSAYFPPSVPWDSPSMFSTLSFGAAFQDIDELQFAAVAGESYYETLFGSQFIGIDLLSGTDVGGALSFGPWTGGEIFCDNTWCGSVGIRNIVLDDGLGVVPLPASGLLLLTVAGGLIAAGRRRGAPSL